jgi:membrane protein implicated in regulation of membrane protease activity
MNTWLWLITAIIFVIIEALTLGLVTIWFAVGALAAFFVAWLGFPWQTQIPFFIGTSFVLLYLTGPIARKYLKIGKTKTNVQALIGEQGIVREKIEQVKQGQIEIKGQFWAARASTDEDIEVNEKVVVQKIEGNTLIVRKLLK